MRTLVKDIAPVTAASHPWISFELDLRRAHSRMWMLLGEARSKARHVALTPVTPDLAEQMNTLYLAKGVQATTAIEGNTLNEEQVEAILTGELVLPPSLQYQEREIKNVQRACKIVEDIVEETGQFEVTPELLDKLNGELLADLELEPGVVAGQVRQGDVTVGRVYIPPRSTECAQLVRAYCDWLNRLEEWDFGPTPRDRFSAAIIRAVLAHLYLVWIHPYGDGNGRLSRLLEVGLLSAAGLPKSVVHLLSNHYNQTRPVYYRRLDEARRQPYPAGLERFITYAIEGMVDQLQAQLSQLHDHVLQISWRDLVDDHYDRQPTVSGRRQIELAVALAAAPGRTAPVKDLRKLTADLAEKYAAASQKTVTRDIGALTKRGLLRREGAYVTSTIESVLMRFMPPAVDSAKETVFDEADTALRRRIPPAIES